MAGAKEELQFLFCGGVFKKALKLICQWKKIFFQITVTLIIPLYIKFLASIYVYRPLLNRAQIGNPCYLSKIFLCSIFRLAHYPLVTLISISATSSLVYTIACIDTGKKPSFKTLMAMGVLSRVFWKRIFHTLIVGVYFQCVLCIVYFAKVALNVPLISNSPILIAYAWIMGVVRVFIGGKKDFKFKLGHIGFSLALFLFMFFSTGRLLFTYKAIVLGSDDDHTGFKILIGISRFLLLVIGFLLGVVTQTVIYFDWKSYHRDGSIDKFLYDPSACVYTKDAQFGGVGIL